MTNQLSQHFSLVEFTRSATAEKLGICNEPPVTVVSNLQCLCQKVLEPLRVYADTPIVISSGYRCQQLNEAVGGVKNSQHCTGEAADIHLPDIKTGRAWFDFIARFLVFDQLIWEHSADATWIHVSHRRRGCNRRRIMEG